MLQGENEIACYLDYDYIFTGVGTSASLLLLELHRRNLLSNLKILLIDPDDKTRNDKTFCFWSHENESIHKALSEIITHSWNTIEIDHSDKRSIDPLRYHHVSSLDLYSKIQELIKHYQWTRVIAPVDNVSSDDIGPYLTIDGQQIRARKIFDSRTPKFEDATTNEVHLFQSFIGWEIETSKQLEGKEAVRLMDFNVEQSEFTQFMYLLPFSKNRYLVELTRFGSEILQENDANRLLENYIGNDFGEYKILSTERGCIPMSNCKIANEHHENVFLLGARNYRIKPSTGYAFKNMYNHAFEIAEYIENNASKSIKAEKQKTSFSKSRFAFYDALLLSILKEKPQSGKKIFSELFKKANTSKVLEFLDEKSKIQDEISLFSRLPWGPFLWALYQKVNKNVSFRPVILLLFTSILLLLGRESMLQSVIGYGLLFVGLIAVGIPHGAVDHLIEIGKWESKKVPMFIVKYLALAALMGICWYFLADWALVVFLLYSAWHFGQADGELWKLNRVTSLLWGTSLLVYILGTHTVETNAILQTIGVTEFAFSLPYWSIIPWLIWSLIQKKSAFTITILWLIIATQLPLLLAFGLYFIGQHSVTSWKHISTSLNQSNRSIWLHSLPFQVGAWLILALFIFLWPTDGIYNFEMLDKFGVFFIFISCISFPHVITMNMLYGAKKTTK
jgi:lycopene beta-cyclase